MEAKMAKKPQWVERDCKEPDKVLCNTQSIRFSLLESGVRFDENGDAYIP